MIEIIEHFYQDYRIIYTIPLSKVINIYTLYIYSALKSVMIIVTQISISNLSTIILTVPSLSGGLNRGIGFPLLTLGTAYRVLHACFLLKRIIEEHALFYFTIYTVVRASSSTMLKKCYFKASKRYFIHFNTSVFK